MYISCTLQNIEATVSGLTARQLDGLKEAVELATVNKVAELEGVLAKISLVTEKLPKVVVEIATNDITDTWLYRFMPTLNGAVAEYLRKNTDQRPEWLKTPEAAQPKVEATAAERAEADRINEYYHIYTCYSRREENIAAVGDGGTEGIYDCSNEQIALYRALDSAREELEAAAL